jgi:hypothetical protein
VESIKIKEKEIFKIIYKIKLKHKVNKHQVDV